MLKWLRMFQRFKPPVNHKTNSMLGRGSHCYTGIDVIRGISFLDEFQDHPQIPVSVILINREGVFYRYPITGIDVIQGELVLYANHP